MFNGVLLRSRERNERVRVCRYYGSSRVATASYLLSERISQTKYSMITPCTECIQLNAINY